MTLTDQLRLAATRRRRLADAVAATPCYPFGTGDEPTVGEQFGYTQGVGDDVLQPE